MLTTKQKTECDRLDTLALAICDELLPRFGPCGRNVQIDKEGATIEILAECHADSWLHLGYFAPDEATAILRTLKALPRRGCEDACLKALGLTREALNDPVRRRE